ncbi:carboxymuconolactone decarboxylase family protein [Leifsonia shinshuensis]|uniref:carboxymuconolactone decarboxylase family protein n=1 Tax=Leifsonia shinshuensis TaxID=150026 RepID=UPI0031EFEF98
MRDPDILGARTRTDNDIFYNEKGGLTRALRELSATAASRTNGCIFWRPSALPLRQPLLEAPRRRAAPPRRGHRRSAGRPAVAGGDRRVGRAHGRPERVRRRERACAAGRGPGRRGDHRRDQRAAFFNWANRLMLSLGEPTPPKA